MIASWSRVHVDPTEYKVVARIAPVSGLASDRLYWTNKKEEDRAG
jgi:hypothetical protein